MFRMVKSEDITKRAGISDKVVFVEKQWLSSRQDSMDLEKYVSVLVSKACEKYWPKEISNTRVIII